jgi:hypothetical protein
MQLSSPAVALQPRSVGQDSSLVEVLLEQQKLMHEREEKLRREFKAEAIELRQAAQSERAVMEAKLAAIEQKSGRNRKGVQGVHLNPLGLEWASSYASSYRVYGVF